MRGVYLFATALLNMAFAFVTEVIGWVFGNFNFNFLSFSAKHVFLFVRCALMPLGRLCVVLSICRYAMPYHHWIKIMMVKLLFMKKIDTGGL